MTEATHELLIDLHDDLLSTRDAATLCGVSEPRIRQWKRRGHLAPAGLDEFGRPLYRGIDVLRAEAETRCGRARHLDASCSLRHAAASG